MSRQQQQQHDPITFMLHTRYENYRRVLGTTDQLQAVAMSIPPGQGIRSEMHAGTTQAFIVTRGHGFAIIGGGEDGRGRRRRISLRPNKVLMVPASTMHEIHAANDGGGGGGGLDLVTFYAPPHHPYGRVQHSQPMSERLL